MFRSATRTPSEILDLIQLTTRATTEPYAREEGGEVTPRSITRHQAPGDDSNKRFRNRTSKKEVHSKRNHVTVREGQKSQIMQPVLNLVKS